MGIFNRLMGRPSNLPLIEGDEVVTLPDSRATQRALKARAKREGWTLPDKVGERYGYPTHVTLVRDETRPDGWRNVVKFQVFGVFLDTWYGEDATPLLRKLDKAGVDAGDLEATMYRGQGGIWRIRVKV